jgi:leucyl aminopeptidase
MTNAPKIVFAKPATPSRGVVAILVPEGGKIGEAARACDPAGVLERAFAITGFKGKLAADIDLLAPEGTAYDRLLAIGAGKTDALDETAWARMGGALAAKTKRAEETTLVLDVDGVDIGGEQAAAVGLGILLGAYSFDRYKTRRDEEGEDKPEPRTRRVTIQCASPAAARRHFAAAQAVAEGVFLARDLVNEPANILGPEEFAARAKELVKDGVEIEILNEKDMRKLGMGALLGVAQGSARPPRLVIMRWNGGKAKEQPVAFLGKGVVFDSGGISIKPAQGMEDMKGDMAGAAAVVGLMRGLALRKARVNAVGIIGLVENMVDGNAQRPGDIVTSMSGQTIEVLNTDAEGRLVLADALWYCRDRFKPKFMINLATLTGAIIVALGHHHAGLFSNNDTLAERLAEAGRETGEKVWRLPLGTEYDKLLDSKNADMKNIGGRHAGAITAAQFLQRFVKDTPWAHLDIAGTGMAAPTSETNPSWGSGFGVRLLDRLVARHYEG